MQPCRWVRCGLVGLGWVVVVLGNVTGCRVRCRPGSVKLPAVWIVVASGVVVVASVTARGCGCGSSGCGLGV